MAQRQPAARKAAARPAAGAAFRIVMMPDYFQIDDLLALPYSAQNQRFLQARSQAARRRARAGLADALTPRQAIDAGQLPHEHLRAFPPLLAKCEGKYSGGNLRVEVVDRRHGHEKPAPQPRTVELVADYAALLQARARARAP